MTSKLIRKIVHIDEDTCNGCGACVPACAEGAIAVIDGKARLVSERYCDGLGACLGECPQGAISVEERESEAFDEEAVRQHLESVEAGETLPCGCPSATVASFGGEPPCEAPDRGLPLRSALGHWPVQLALVPPAAPFLRDADVLLAADCVPFAYPAFHRDFLEGRVLLVACPKLDDFPAHRAKLAAILKQNNVRNITVVHMEVPCCSGLVHLARQAVAASGKGVPLHEVTVGARGEILAEAGCG